MATSSTGYLIRTVTNKSVKTLLEKTSVIATILVGDIHNTWVEKPAMIGKNFEQYFRDLLALDENFMEIKEIEVNAELYEQLDSYM